MAAAVLSLVVLSACGRAAPPSPGPVTPSAATSAEPPAEETPAVVPTRAPSPTSLPSPTPGPRIFTIGLVTMPGTLDPANALDRSALIIARHLYAGLTTFAPGSTWPMPALAETWDLSPDGLTWTFRLRRGAVFSDGSPVTAEAVRLNFERWLSAAPPGHYTFWRAVFGGFVGEQDATGEPLALLAEVTVADELTVALTLHRPDATLPNSLALPSFGIVNPRVFAAGSPAALDQTSAGAGPYVLAEAGQPDLVRLVRNVHYWGAAADPGWAAGPDELVFKVIPDDTQRLLALRTGEIEAMAEVNPADYATVSAPDSGTRLEFDPALNVLYLGINQAHAPWDQLECRQALAHALDRERYVRDYFPGDAQLATAMQPPTVWGFAPPHEDYVFDPALAREQWQTCLEAGIAPPASVTLYVPPIPRSYLPDPAGLGGAIRADLAALSLTVEIASPDWQTTWLADVHSGRADLFLLGWTGVNGDPDAFLCPLFCGREGAFNADADGNPIPPDADLAEVLRAARTTGDRQQREVLYAQAHKLIRANLPAVPLAHRQTAWAFRAEVHGYTPSPIESLFTGLVLP
ncbi:MAG: hypothetical protein IT318_14605 [Anaerolineales bacterium]|nr:hypothetical protein [Anaerolineales bacterium]